MDWWPLKQLVSLERCRYFVHGDTMQIFAGPLGPNRCRFFQCWELVDKGVVRASWYSTMPDMNWIETTRRAVGNLFDLVEAGKVVQGEHLDFYGIHTCFTATEEN